MKDSYNDRIANYTRFIHEGRSKLGTAKGYKILIKGLTSAAALFKEINLLKDIDLLIQSELLFIKQELSAATASEVIASLKNAEIDITDAYRSLQVLKQPEMYRLYAAPTHSSNPAKAADGMPKDIFHIACIAETTRLNNSLKNTSLIEEDRILIEQRKENMKTIRKVYKEMQQTALMV
jgi:hypothetical protein